jgi:hypothetical protein
MTAAAAALPPLLHSVWWNHRDPNSGSEAFPHLRQYNREGWGQRWRRRAKRQAENQVIFMSQKDALSCFLESSVILTGNSSKVS